jgi:hypothetical protein
MNLLRFTLSSILSPSSFLGYFLLHLPQSLSSNCQSLILQYSFSFLSSVMSVLPPGLVILPYCLLPSSIRILILPLPCWCYHWYAFPAMSMQALPFACWSCHLHTGPTIGMHVLLWHAGPTIGTLVLYHWHGGPGIGMLILSLTCWSCYWHAGPAINMLVLLSACKPCHLLAGLVIGMLVLTLTCWSFH